MKELFQEVYEKNLHEFEFVCKKIAEDKLNPLLEYLSTTDFYYSPAARHYHDSYPGGLYDHCKLLFGELINFKSKMNKNWEDIELLIIAFGHDLCKINLYLPEIKDNVLTYKYNPQKSTESHGTESLTILANLIPELINERIANSIVCHMGLWTLDVPDIDKYMKDAQIKDDLVFFTHCADMIASRSGKTCNEIKVVDNKLIF